MGRKEERYKRKLGMAPPKPSQVDKEKMLTPFMMGDTKIIPVTADQAPAPEVGGSDMMTADEFQKITHTLSDKELNRIIYQNARDAVENGLMPPWPKDDYGTVMWFTMPSRWQNWLWGTSWGNMTQISVCPMAAGSLTFPS